MKKVFVSKNDSIAEVVEKVISEPEVEIVLVVPKNTLLQDSVSNFHLLKRESDAAGKLVTVESVDEDILALAKASRIEAIHPLFKKKKGSPLSDIVARDEDLSESLSKSTSRRSSKILSRKKVAEEPIEEEPTEESEQNSVSESKPEDFETPEEDGQNWRPKSKLKIFIISALVVAALVVVFSVFYYTREAKINITFNSKPFTYGSAFIASVNSSEIDNSLNLIPAEIFTQSKNYTELFPASGRSNVSEKATGKLLIYNAYSSQKQTLVVNTRFETPDGKIYRLQNQVDVPGAQIKDGKIIPSSIETTVVADKAGPSYNSGPIEKLTIPGFRDPEKFKGFYGSLVSASGGFVGEKAVPTDKDIIAAKAKIEETLKQSLEKSLSLEKPEGFKILEGATDIVISKTSVNKSTNEKGEFSVFGEGEFRAIGFKEGDLKTLLTSKSENSDGLVFKNVTLNYDKLEKNFSKKELKFTLSAVGVLTEDFNPTAFKEKILSLSIDAAQTEIKKLEGLSGAKISISPSWIKTLPAKAEKIEIKVD